MIGGHRVGPHREKPFLLCQELPLGSGTLNMKTKHTCLINAAAIFTEARDDVLVLHEDSL